MVSSVWARGLRLRPRLAGPGEASSPSPPWWSVFKALPLHPPGPCKTLATAVPGGALSTITQAHQGVKQITGLTSQGDLD